MFIPSLVRVPTMGTPLRVSTQPSSLLPAADAAGGPLTGHPRVPAGMLVESSFVEPSAVHPGQLIQPMTPSEVFTAQLLPQETIEWRGRPNPSVIFHQEDWYAIPFSLMWGGFAIFWLLGASGIWDLSQHRPAPAFEWFAVIWGTPFVIVGQYMIWGRFLYRRWVKHRTYYGLTNRRALVVQQGFRNRSCSSAYYESLPMIDKQVRMDGIGSISFGGPVTGEWQWGRGNPPRPLTFDDVDNADAVYQIVIQRYDRARNSALSGR